MTKYRHNSRGAVLFFVLGLVFLMSIIVTLFLELSWKKMREQAVSYVADDLRTPAYSALEVTLGVLNMFREEEGSLTGPAQGWSNPITFSGVPFSPDLNLKVTIADETGKFPFLIDDRQMMLDFYTAMGFDLSDAEILNDSLHDWMDEDDNARLAGAEEDYYERETPSYKPPNRPLTSFSELRYIQGFKEWFFDEDGNPNVKYQIITNTCSLHHQGKINIHTAPTQVWSLFSEMEGVDLSNVAFEIEGEDGIPGTADDKYIDPSLLQGQNINYIGSQMEVFKVTVDVSRGDSHFILNTLISAAGSSGGGSQNNRNNQNNNQNNRGGGIRNNVSSGSSINYPFTILQIAENQPIE